MIEMMAHLQLTQLNIQNTKKPIEAISMVKPILTNVYIYIYKPRGEQYTKSI